MYDHLQQMYFREVDGLGPFPVLTKGRADSLQHLAIPQLFITGIRVAVCNQNIALDWCVGWSPEPFPVCVTCIEKVEAAT